MRQPPNLVGEPWLSHEVRQRLHRFVDVLTTLICVGFLLLLVDVGWQAMQFGWIERSPVLQVPKAYVHLAMPVGSGLMLLNTLVLLLERGLFSREYRRTAVASEASGLA